MYVVFVPRDRLLHTARKKECAVGRKERRVGREGDPERRRCRCSRCSSLSVAGLVVRLPLTGPEEHHWAMTYTASQSQPQTPCHMVSTPINIGGMG